MAELRWLLLAAGILILALIFWAGRREAAGKPVVPPQLRRRPPALAPVGDAIDIAPPANAGAAAPAQRPIKRIVTVRLTAHGNASFSGEALIGALQQAGLQHGRFGIFHHFDAGNEEKTLFSVASLVEPGSFDLGRAPNERYPGVSFFLSLPGSVDGLVAFDAMLAAARGLARTLDGELLDENGSRLSVQRERYLREEVIQLQHKLAPS